MKKIVIYLATALLTFSFGSVFSPNPVLASSNSNINVFLTNLNR